MKHAKKITRRFWPLVACVALLLVLLAQPAPAAIKIFGSAPTPILCGPIPTTGAQPAPPVRLLKTSYLTSTTNKTAFYDTTLKSVAQSA